MPVFDVYIYAVKQSGSYSNGSHRSSNGYVYTYTEVDETILYLSIPYLLLNQSIINKIRSFFSTTINKTITYTDWVDESIGITEAEIDLTELLSILNKDYFPPYSQVYFRQGNKEICQYTAGNYVLFPVIEKHEDLR